jgi:SAM-dependent methyltransferase
VDDFAVYEAFSPQDYLQSYYGSLLSEADGLLKFLVDTFSRLRGDISLLEFGGGPTLIGLIPAARRATNIHFCDYVTENRDVINRWLAGDVSDFDWSAFVARTLEYEGVVNPAQRDIEARCAQIRSAVTAVTTCDVYSTPPVVTENLFDVVLTNYCLDAVTNDKNEWHGHIANLKTLLKPGGIFVFSSLLEARYSDFGDTRFPNVYLQEPDVRRALELTGFLASSIRVETAPADHADREYRGVIFASATR